MMFGAKRIGNGNYRNTLVNKGFVVSRYRKIGQPVRRFPDVRAMNRVAVFVSKTNYFVQEVLCWH